MKKMKAYVFHGINNCKLEDVAIPDIKDDEVLVQVKSCGICGTDIHINNGKFAAKKDLILGHEFAGIVANTGNNVEDLSLGDRVVGDPMIPCFKCDYCQSGQVNYCVNLPGIGVNLDGAFAEFIAIPRSNVHKLAEETSFANATFAEPLSCCIRGMDLLDIKSGENAVIIGDGPVGLLFVQLARLAGVNDIVFVGKKDNRKILAEKYGINNFVYGNKDNAKEQINKYLEGKQINSIIEAVGRPETINLSIDIANYGSNILWFGVPNPDDEIKIKPQKIFEKEIKIMGSLMNPYTIKRAINLIESGDVEVASLITHRFSLSEIDNAFATYKNNRNKIKIIIDI